jgi:hypothetical protein
MRAANGVIAAAPSAARDFGIVAPTPRLAPVTRAPCLREHPYLLPPPALPGSGSWGRCPPSACSDPLTFRQQSETEPGPALQGNPTALVYATTLATCTTARIFAAFQQTPQMTSPRALDAAPAPRAAIPLDAGGPRARSRSSALQTPLHVKRTVFAYRSVP